MKNSYKNYILYLCGFIGVFLIVFFRPSVWQDRIDQYLNDQLSKSGWSLNNSVFSGHLFTKLSSSDVLLKSNKGTSIVFPSINARIKIFPLLMGKINLNELSVSNAIIKPSLKLNEDPSTRAFSGIKQIPIDIDKLNIDGDIVLFEEDSTQLISFLINGGITSKEDNLVINIGELSIFLNDPSINIKIKRWKGFLSDEKIAIDLKNAIINDINLGGFLEYNFSNKSKINGNILLQEYKLPESIFSELPLQPNLSTISANFSFQSNANDYFGKLKIENELGLNMDGAFKVETDSTHIKLTELQLSGNKTTLSLSGLYEESGRFNGIARLDNLDFSQWLIDSKKTGISGYLLLDGIFKDMLIASLDINADVNESLIFNGESTSFSGSVSYADSVLSIVNPIMLSIGPSIVSVQGKANYNQELINLDVSMTEASAFLINNFWSDSLSNGSATGSMQINGGFDNLTVDADLLINDFNYNNIFLENFELFAKLDNLQNYNEGEIKIKFTDGTWNEVRFESGNAQLYLKDQIITISSFELRNNDDFFQINGSFKGDSLLLVDQMQLAYKNHYLVNPSQLRILIKNNKIYIKPFEIHIDDGIVKGSFETNPFVGNLKFSNVTADLLPLFNIKRSQYLRGNIFGEIFFPKDNSLEQVKLNLSVKEGSYKSQEFDDLYLNAAYQNGIISIDSLSLFDEDKSSFVISGTLPFPVNSQASQKTQLQSKFKNYELSFLSEFSNDILSRIKGSFTGDFSINGNTFKTGYKIDGKITDAYWGRLPLGLVKGRGEYKNKRLFFDNFSSDYNQNHYEGSASIPIDIDFVSKSRKLPSSSNLNLNSKGSFRSAEFLSAYISEIDSIIGVIDFDFNIGGSLNSLSRDGRIDIKNGEVYTILMDEPIRQIFGGAILNKNVMTIESINGYIMNSNMKNQNSSLSNFSLEGNIDFTKFFEPRYKLNANGKNIFFRSLNQDIESFVDLNVDVFGKDTIDIAGTITARNGAIYKEFKNSESIRSSNSSDRVITNYNIRFPIEDSFSIRNSQIDAKISGELGISKLYQDEWNYSGEIEFIQGEIYYYLGDVFEDLKGTMIFDGQGFNPFLDLTASTQIGEAEIILGVFGPFNNPEWRFESDKGYSESDILQLLTFNTRVAEEGFSTEGLGTQAQTILGAYLERQLEKNFIKSTGLKSSGIIQDVQISGASELINPNQGDEFSINARLNQNFSLSYKRSFSLEAAYKNKVGVEYKLNPNFSVIGNVDETGQVQMKFRVRRVY